MMSFVNKLLDRILAKLKMLLFSKANYIIMKKKKSK